MHYFDNTPPPELGKFYEIGAILAGQPTAVLFAVSLQAPSPSAESTCLPVSCLTLIFAEITSQERDRATIKRFRRDVRTTYPGITTVQIDGLISLCRYPTRILTAETRKECIVILPDGDLRYVTRYFELVSERDHWVLIGTEHVKIGDLPAAARCAELLRRSHLPENLPAAFSTPTIPSPEVTFLVEPIVASHPPLPAADPTPAEIHLVLRPMALDGTGVGLPPDSKFNHFLVVDIADETKDLAVIAAHLTERYAATHPTSPAQIQTLAEWACAPADELAFAAAQNLTLSIALDGALRTAVAGSVLQRLRGEWHLVTPQSGSLPSLEAALSLADALAGQVKDSS